MEIRHVLYPHCPRVSGVRKSRVVENANDDGEQNEDRFDKCVHGNSPQKVRWIGIVDVKSIIEFTFAIPIIIQS